MKKEIKYGIVGVILVLLVIGFSMQNQELPANEKEMVRIGYTSLVYGQPSFIADDLGFFANEGLNVEMIKFESSTHVVNSLLAGDLDIVAISPCISAFAAEEKSKEDLFKILYYNTDSVEHPISFLLVKKGSGINTLEDLKGKKIGTFPGNILSQISTKLLLKDKMDIERDITLVDIGPQIQAQAIETGMVDAMFSLEPFATITMELGIADILHVAPQLSIMDDIPGGCGFASTKFVNERPIAAENVRLALDKAVDYIRANELDAKKVFPKYTPLNENLAEKVKQPEFVKSTELSVQKLQEEYDVLKREGVFKGNLDAKTIVYEIR